MHLLALYILTEKSKLYQNPGFRFLFPNSVRVSNELGAGNATAAKFSVLVVSATSVAIGVVCMIIVLATREYFPHLFTTSDAVAKETTRLAILLGFTVLLNSLQPVLSGTLTKN